MSEAPPRGSSGAPEPWKTAGRQEPDFTGRMGIPGRDNEHGVALWVRKDKHQHPYFSGRMDPMPLTVMLPRRLTTSRSQTAPEKSSKQVPT